MHKLFIFLAPTLIGICMFAFWVQNHDMRSQMNGLLGQAGLHAENTPGPLRKSGCILRHAKADRACTVGQLYSMFDQQEACVRLEMGDRGEAIPDGEWGKALSAYGIKNQQASRYRPGMLIPYGLGGMPAMPNLWPIPKRSWKKWSRQADEVVLRVCKDGLDSRSARGKLFSAWSAPASRVRHPHHQVQPRQRPPLPDVF